jgi:hypothetical protein
MGPSTVAENLRRPFPGLSFSDVAAAAQHFAASKNFAGSKMSTGSSRSAASARSLEPGVLGQCLTRESRAQAVCGKPLKGVFSA